MTADGTWGTGSNRAGRHRSTGVLRRVVRGEGWRAASARALDRFASWRRRRSYRELSWGASANRLPSSFRAQLDVAPLRVLNLLPTEPRPDLGGVQTQFRLRLDAEARRRPTAVLYPLADGHRLELDVSSAGDPRTGRLAIRLPASRDLSEALRRSLDLCDAHLLHVEQALGLPWADLLGAARGLRNGLVLSVHDFGLFCPRPHLIERPQMTFCDFCRDETRCIACLRHGAVPDARSGDQAARRSAASRVLDAATAVVFPSPYLRDAHARLFPEAAPSTPPAGTASGRWHVVPPPSFNGASHLPPRRRSAAGTGDRTLRVAYVGSFRPHKGSAVFLEVLDALGSEPGLEWHLLGGGDADLLAALRRRRGVTVHGYYRAGRLPHRLRDLGIDLALVLSIWPETYCMTVDECLRASVPVLAFHHGAPGERLARVGGGLLVDPAAGPAGVAARLRAVLVGRDSLPEVGTASDALPTADDAADAVQRVYRTLTAEGSRL